MQITYKFRLYPGKEDEKKLLSVLEICRLLYNSFLSIWNDSDKIPSRYTLQAKLPDMKEEHDGLKKVNLKTLQMVLFMLYNNLKVLRELKKKGRKLGKLCYKKYGNVKSFILNRVGLGNTIIDMKEMQGVDMRKEVINYFVERFVGVNE